MRRTRGVARITRVLGAAIAAAPGAALVALYLMRLEWLRDNPAGSPGTPAETVIAVMVAGVAVASFLFARAVAAGQVARPVGAAGVLGLVAGVVGLTFSMTVLA